MPEFALRLRVMHLGFEGSELVRRQGGLRLGDQRRAARPGLPDRRQRRLRVALEGGAGAGPGGLRLAAQRRGPACAQGGGDLPLVEPAQHVPRVAGDVGAQDPGHQGAVQLRLAGGALVVRPVQDRRGRVQGGVGPRARGRSEVGLRLGGGHAVLGHAVEMRQHAGLAAPELVDGEPVAEALAVLVGDLLRTRAQRAGFKGFEPAADLVVEEAEAAVDLAGIVGSAEVALVGGRVGEQLGLGAQEGAAEGADRGVLLGAAHLAGERAEGAAEPFERGAGGVGPGRAERGQA